MDLEGCSLRSKQMSYKRLSNLTRDYHSREGMCLELFKGINSRFGKQPLLPSLTMTHEETGLHFSK